MNYQKKKSAETLLMKLPSRTPEAQVGQTSTSSISNSAGNVKEKLSDRDNVGRQLSVEQQEFFAESKVRDENGNLIALYHGTENGGFTVFDAAKSDDGLIC